MVDEEDPLEVVHFMLDADGEQAFAVDLLRLAVIVEELHPHARRALDVLIKVGNREAAFLARDHFVGGPGYLGVHEVHRLAGREDLFLRGFLEVFAVLVHRAGDVDDEDALGHADLDRGQADARCVVHGLEHVIHQRAQVVRDFLHGFGDLLEARVGRDEDGPEGHGISGKVRGLRRQGDEDAAPVAVNRGRALNSAGMPGVRRPRLFRRAW